MRIALIKDSFIENIVVFDKLSMVQATTAVMGVTPVPVEDLPVQIERKIHLLGEGVQ